MGGVPQRFCGCLVGKLCSALCSAAGQNLAAVLGCHSLTETVLFLALTLLGLIGTKHFIAPAFQIKYSTAAHCVAVVGLVVSVFGLFRRWSKPWSVFANFAKTGNLLPRDLRGRKIPSAAQYIATDGLLYSISWTFVNSFSTKLCRLSCFSV
jgi:hypothetical protein